MSWLSSLSNQFNQESETEIESEEENISRRLHHQHIEEETPSDGGDYDGGGGGGGGGVKVKENLSEEIRKSIGRQLRCVASFLAPPPISLSTATTSPVSSSSTAVTTDSFSSQSLVGGIKSDFAEISGSLKSGLTLFSSNKAVSGISRLATTLLQFPKVHGEDEEEEEEKGLVAAGVDQQVLEFVRIMSSRPECWTEFPLPLRHYNDYNLSEAQRDHASTVEQLAPSLEDLRYKLCPSFMSEDRFWMIYFIMLYPRLSESDAMLLSTPQIVEVRKVLLQSLQNKTDAAVHGSTSKVDDVERSHKDSNTRGEFGTVKQKEVLAESIYSTRQENVDKQENVDQWLEEEDVETGTSFASLKQIGNDEDVSFSDLEDDDNDASTSPPFKAQNTQGCSPSNSNDWVELSENFASTSPARKAQNAQDGSTTNSIDWFQLSENSDNGNASRIRGGHSTSREKDSEGEESNDWLNIDDF